MNQILPIAGRAKVKIVVAAVVSLIAWSVLQTMSPARSIQWSQEMREAADRMLQAINAVAKFCETAGTPINESLDPNRTCLIGPEYTPLFTTLGQLEAKRTTTNPNIAGLLVHILRSAGVSAGDTIAVGASASFPALVIATLTAAEALDINPVTILSLGASSYGATRPEFNLLHIHELLLSEGIISAVPAAVSLGGEGDVGSEFDAVMREDLIEQIRNSVIPLIVEPDLRGNVARRLEIYLGASERRRLAAFVNVGGSAANIGSSPKVLTVESGLNTKLDLPPERERGVLYEMAARGIPVIHLLNVRGLTLRYGLPWDPLPLPEPGTARMRDDGQVNSWRFWLLTIAYFLTLVSIALVGWDGRTAVGSRSDSTRDCYPSQDSWL